MISRTLIWRSAEEGAVKIGKFPSWQDDVYKDYFFLIRLGSYGSIKKPAVLELRKKIGRTTRKSELVFSIKTDIAVQVIDKVKF